MSSPWPRAILHFELDAFYVNVHLLDNPQDRGLPLAVGGKPEDGGFVRSTSDEAGKFGVRSGMTMKKAVRICPQIKVVAPDWERIYRRSREVMAILREFGRIEKINDVIAYVDLSASHDPQAQTIAIQERIKTDIGFPVGSVSQICMQRMNYDKCRSLLIRRFRPKIHKLMRKVEWI